MLQHIAIGTAQFGLNYGIANQKGQIGVVEGRAILAEASNLGIKTLDTAIAYGESEETLGKIGVKDWQIVTKLPEMPDGVLDVDKWVRSQVLNAIQRLGVGSVYAVLLHRPGQLLNSNGKSLSRALEAIKSEGLIEKTGVSVYSPEELEPILNVAPIELVQAPLSIFDQRMVDTGWAERLNSMGVELHTRSAFLQGLLLMESKARPTKFKRWSALWQAWDGWLHDNNLTPLQACTRFVLSMMSVDRVVLGVDSLEQLREIAASTNGALPRLPEILADVDPMLLNPAEWSNL